jgi:beta-galactosidase beta subunit
MTNGVDAAEEWEADMVGECDKYTFEAEPEMFAIHPIEVHRLLVYVEMRNNVDNVTSGNVWPPLLME